MRRPLAVTGPAGVATEARGLGAPHETGSGISRKEIRRPRSPRPFTGVLGPTALAERAPAGTAGHAATAASSETGRMRPVTGGFVDIPLGR